MAGGAQVSPLAGIGQDPFRAAFVTANPGEALMEIPTGQVPDHDLLQIRAPEAVAPLEPLWPNLLQALIVVLHTLVKGRQVGLARSVDRAGVGHRRASEKQGKSGRAQPGGSTVAITVPGQAEGERRNKGNPDSRGKSPTPGERRGRRQVFKSELAKAENVQMPSHLRNI